MITAHDIIIKPIITEKSMALTEANKYTFKVMKKANKAMLGTMIMNFEKLYNFAISSAVRKYTYVLPH